jgi:hypothetical protein
MAPLDGSKDSRAMSDVSARLAVRGIGATGLVATAVAATGPAAPSLAVALGLSTVAGGLLASALAAAVLRPRYPLDRPARNGARPGPRDGIILLGKVPGGEARVSPARLAGGLRVAGPDASRRALLAEISRQAAEAGIGHAVVSCSQNDALVDRVVADGAGNPWSLTVVDTETSDARATHSLAPFAGLPPQAVIRVLLAADPRLRRDGPHATSARSLLRAVVPILCHRHDGSLGCYLKPRLLADQIELRRVIDLADPDLSCDLAEDMRSGVGSYLSTIPGFQPEKKYKQAVPTTEHHAAAVAMIEEGIKWTYEHGSPPCLWDVPDAFACDLVAPGMRTVIRAAHGGGDERALRLMVAVLSEALRERPKGGEGAFPFLVIADLEGFPDDVAGSVLAMARSGAAVVAGAGTPGSPGSVLAAGSAGLTLTLPGFGSGAPARLDADGTALSVRMAEPSPARTPSSLRRRIPVDRPTYSDLESTAQLSRVIARLVDPGLPREQADRARAMSEAQPTLAEAGDVIAVATRRMSMFGHEDPLEAACGSLAAAAELFGDPPPLAGRAAGRPASPREARAPGASGDLLFDFDDVLDAPAVVRAPARRGGRGPCAVVVPASVATDPLVDDASWREAAGKAIPLATLPDQAAARDVLAAEFPHLAHIVGPIVDEAARGGHVRLRPILLHGAAGSGKSRLARRLGEVLGLRPLTINCGGASDSSFGGTSRQWKSARPSVVLQHISRTGIANPAIVLDEVEKIGDSRHNGNMGDLMLGLTERETSRRSFDPYLEAEVDLSHVAWIGTANSLGTLHPAFRDRFRKFEVPLPGLRHADVLIPTIVAVVNADRGLAPEWAFAPNEGETAMIAELWGGGSIRRLRTVVEKVVDRVERMDRGRMH